MSASDKMFFRFMGAIFFLFLVTIATAIQAKAEPSIRIFGVGKPSKAQAHKYRHMFNGKKVGYVKKGSKQEYKLTGRN